MLNEKVKVSVLLWKLLGVCGWAGPAWVVTSVKMVSKYDSLSPFTSVIVVVQIVADHCFPGGILVS